MKLFQNKETKFISSECPGCGANLEIDRIEGMAKCPYCGTECILEKANAGVIDSVIGFVERQQRNFQKKREEKRKLKEEKKQKRKAHFKKFGWIYCIVGISFLVLFCLLCVKCLVI